MDRIPNCCSCARDRGRTRACVLCVCVYDFVCLCVRVRSSLPLRLHPCMLWHDGSSIELCSGSTANEE